MTVRASILAALARSPLDNATIADLLADHSGGVARTMSKLQHLGLVENTSSTRGRGSRATYAITQAGRDWLHAERRR